AEDDIRSLIQSGPLAWMVAPDDPASLIVSIPKMYYRFDDGSWLYHGWTCTFYSYWWRTDVFLNAVPNPYRVRLSSKQPDLTDTDAIKIASDLRPININLSSIEFLTAEIFFANEALRRSERLAMVWAATLAAVPMTQLHEYREAIENSTAGGGQKASDAEENAPEASYTITTLFHGFGYGPTDTASNLSAAVIATYCLISLLFIAYITTTGHTSIAWDSAIELVVLALQSKEPGGLGHVSVGLDSMNTFRRTIGIRVNTVPVGDTGETRERLELIFEHDRDAAKRGLTKVVRNRAY
ncbi:hypothetical protein G6514_009691, partial [Epicoccum nigrum]